MPELYSHEFLEGIMKPARYLGNEWNISRKKIIGQEARIALCFPDLYELGMSNLGLRILYGLLNNCQDIVCERVFHPDRDMESRLRQYNFLLATLESGSSVKEFDFLGFSLGSELNYTNVLSILELSGIPILAQERGANFPLVIGGGPCTLNPEPMHAFFDLFVIGEGEEVILELIRCYLSLRDDYRKNKIDKNELLKRFASIEGVYVPSFYEAGYNSSGVLEFFKPKLEGVPANIKKRIVSDMENSFYPLDWLVPYIPIVHDRLNIEITRGCPNHCRFCQARVQYYPLRMRSASKVKDCAAKGYQKSGYDEISLTGLSVSDYPGIESLVEDLINYFKQHTVSVSLPSIKPKALVKNISAVINSIKKTGLTFAPEAATLNLRKRLGKDFDEDEFWQIISKAYELGYRHVKLYFMTGLPQETEADILAIADFAKKVSRLKKPAAQVNVSINTMIPKPHTCFQWFKMDTLLEMQQKNIVLKRSMEDRKIKLNFHAPKMSMLEGILSRGDRRLSAVILEAHRRGCRFDAWDDHFQWEKWLEAFSFCGINPEDYLLERNPNELLPWDFIDTGIEKEYLIDEYNKTIATYAVED